MNRKRGEESSTKWEPDEKHTIKTVDGEYQCPVSKKKKKTAILSGWVASCFICIQFKILKTAKWFVFVNRCCATLYRGEKVYFLNLWYKLLRFSFKIPLAHYSQKLIFLSFTPKSSFNLLIIIIVFSFSSSRKRKGPTRAKSSKMAMELKYGRKKILLAKTARKVNSLTVVGRRQGAKKNTAGINKVDNWWPRVPTVTSA